LISLAFYCGLKDLSCSTIHWKFADAKNKKLFALKLSRKLVLTIWAF
jgi:hypothetical protein